MGENQGMIWIILGVLVVAAAVIFLGSSMGSTMDKSAADTAAASVLTFEACTKANTPEDIQEVGYMFSPVNGDGVVVADKADFEKCIAVDLV